MLRFGINIILFGIFVSISFANNDLNDVRCTLRQDFSESAKSSVSELCLQAKLEKDASNNKNYIFTYSNGTGPGFSYGDGGLIAAASVRNWPALINQGVSMVVLYLKPCGLNLPHIHPRATTISYVAKGIIRTGSWSENTGQFHAITLKAGQGTTFPAGALHFEQNIGCDDAIVVAAFNSEDPGTAQLTEGIKVLPLDILTTSFGSESQYQIDQLRRNFPKTPIKGIASCYKACGLDKNGNKIK
ncbi:unnamed protein product [Rotaria sordida]|uniref:Cupin type-1 domain-containing protein n=1 Tax=Rotaria sordida TaxID=392033 RepID=A0A815DM59_9BILA|nr:unnamed protein product [Rotaria sordida]CAF1215087.1 unnamed protein product [Rotaria sordida]CAF1298336.1 unnamed protein product [Rotaria sordida]CAF1461097.1 unnamed protein product [Rotaria sordida]CAF3778609.1 unnamed protein product [Rotaria sordida]